MIIKAASRCNVKFWAKHLTDRKNNDRAEMVDKRGLASENLTDMLHEIQDNAHLTKCKNAMYVASFSPAIGEKLTEADWERAFEIFEKHRGIPEGQRRIVYEHEKGGRVHRHVTWDRIDVTKMKAFPDALDWKVCATASQEITHELGLQHTRGILFREPGAPRPERNPKSWEMFRGMKTEIDVQDLAADVKALHRESENGQEFKATLEQHGFQLAIGNRGLLILDSAGKEHSLARRCGVTLKEINAFMQDVDREALPTLEQAKEQYRAQIHAQRQNELSSVRYQIQWEETLDKAAIAKEEQAPQFIEPPPRQEIETAPGQAQANGQQEKEIRGTLPAAHQQEPAHDEQRKPAAPQLGKIGGEIRLSYSLTNTGQEFINALEDRGLTFSEMREADAERLNRWERQRLRELAAAAPQLDAPQQTPIDAKPLTRTDTWMAQSGGVNALSPELLDSAQRSYDRWPGDKARHHFADYVSFVQDKEQERRDSGQQQEQPAKERDRYKAGELVVVDQYGNIHQLNARNTGDDLKARAEHLKDVDRAALPSVTAAQGAMKLYQQHQREGRQHAWEEKQNQWQRDRDEKLWPTKPPQPERQSWTAFREAATAGTGDKRTEKLRGEAAKLWNIWRQSDPAYSAKAERAIESAETHGSASVRTRPHAETFAAALDDRGISFAAITKEEADRSHREAELARAAGNYAPRFKEGEIVIVTEKRAEYRRDGQTNEPPRVHKLDQTLAAKFLQTLDNRSQIQSLAATLKASDSRAQQRAADNAAQRLERATNLKDTSRTAMGNAAKAPALVGKLATKALTSVTAGAEKVAELLTGFFDPGPPKTAAQIETAINDNERAATANEQAERASDTHAAQVHHADIAAQKLKQNLELIAQQRRDYLRHGGGDDRDRDR